MNKERISGTQMAMLLLMTILSTSILFVPGIIAQKAHQSAWIVPLFLPFLVGCLGILILSKLNHYFPRKSLPQYSELLLGKVAGKILGSLYASFFIFINFLIICEFSEFVNTNFLPHTPIVFLNIIIMILAIYAAYEGFEVITRMTQFLLPLFLLSIVVSLLLSIPKMDFSYLLPLFEGGVGPILRGSIAPAAWFGEVIILAMVFPFVNKPKEVKKKGIIVIVIVALIMSLETLVTLTVLGPQMTSSLHVPFWELTRYIEYKKYIQRLEIIITSFWTAGMMLKVAIFNYLVCLSWQQVFGLKSHKPLIFPAALIQVLLASVVFSNTAEFAQFLDKVWPPIGLVFEIGIPLLILVIAFLKRKIGGSPS